MNIAIGILNDKIQEYRNEVSEIIKRNEDTTSPAYEYRQGNIQKLQIHIKTLEEVVKELSKDSTAFDLLSEIRNTFLVNAEFDTGQPTASMTEIMDLWGRVNEFLEIKTIK